MRLIDADAFHEQLEEIRQEMLEENTFSSDFSAEVIETVQDEYLRNMPTVDAALVVHAKWEQYPDAKHMRCSNCKVERRLDHTMLFCPHCGAKMDGGNEDDL